MTSSELRAAVDTGTLITYRYSIVRKFFDFFSWGFLLLFFIPTVLIMASWNALPGDTLYGTKLAFESALLAIAKPSLAASGSLSIKYTERRFSEAKQLLSNRNSVAGLAYVGRQVIETKTVIASAPPSATKQELVRTYLITLQNLSNELEQQKELAAGRAGQPLPAKTGGQTAVSFPSSAAETPAAVVSGTGAGQTSPSVSQNQTAPTGQAGSAAAQEGETVAEITQTQQTVDETIDELQKTMQESAGSEKGGNNEKDKNDKGNKREDNGKEGERGRQGDR